MNDNPLGALQGTSSQQFHLNTLDFQKVGRMVLVQIIGLGLTLGVPWLLKLSYVWKGHDYTPDVLIAVNCLAELGRRFLTGAPKT